MPAAPASGIPRNYSPPFPNLNTYPQSGSMSLIPWAEVASFDLSAGEDGCTLGMTIMIYWQDLSLALQAILGYSYLQSNKPGSLLRALPWQNPKYSQLWAHSVVRVEGRRLEGFTIREPGNIKQDGPGVNATVDVGPSSEYNLALITIRFWRPPYAVLTDETVAGKEWLRFIDRNWVLESQYLTREGSNMWWSDADGTGGETPNQWPTPNSTVPQPMGLVVSHCKYARRWYQLPESSLFQPSDGFLTPTGLPYNLMYTQTQTTNPITAYVYAAGNPINGTINAPIGGDPWNGNAHTAGNLDTVVANQFFGMPMGTLRFEVAEVVPRPLQLPASLMQIPIIANNEALSQVQYDVVFHFDFCDPPRGSNSAGVQNYFRGHNNAPWGGDNFWYPLRTQKTVGNTGKYATPYNYSDMSDLFKLLTLPVQN